MRITILLCIILLTAAASQGAIIRVEATGLGDYPTIQAAIAAAENDDIIELGDGTYSGAGNRDVNNLDKSIFVRSASGNPTACIIDCQANFGDPHYGFLLSITGTNTDCGLEGITITNGYNDYGGAVMVMNHATPSFINCHFLDNTAFHYGGGVYFYTTEGVFENCLFANNTANSGGGVYAMANTMMRLDYCTFVHNRANYGGHIASGAILFVFNSILAFSQSGESIWWTGSKLNIGCCDFFGNPGGDWIGEFEGWANEYDNIWADPLFCDRSNSDFTLYNGSPCSEEVNQCGLMGAFGQDCGAIGNEDTGLGDLKALFR